MSAPAKANTRPSRKEFKRVRGSADEKVATKENEVRIVASRGQRMYIKYAIDILNGAEGKEKHEAVILSGMGNAVYNVVNIAEILKRRVKGLHQTTEISSQTMTDKYEAVEEGKEGMSVERKVSVIEIVLSTAQLDKNHTGYQEPLPESEVSEQDERVNETRERRPRRARGGAKGEDETDRNKRAPREKDDRPARREGGRGGRREEGAVSKRDEAPARRGRGGRGGHRDERDGRAPPRDTARRPERDDRPRRQDGGRGDRDRAREGRRDDRAPRREGGRSPARGGGGSGGRGGSRGRGGYSEGRAERGGRN